MPFETVNGARIFYETYGRRKEGETPILLMHGAPQTGRASWRTVALRLESEHFIILPDLRGHGQSDNPRHSYTFKEHAADMAALVRALGFERAHVVGHSNGGNIAVVMLMTQPQVLQTLVIQAGNAWVSDDLKERLPRLFEPGFIERERPFWMRNLQEMHGDKWRELVTLVANETSTEPNYLPEDLAQADRPVLVVQGEEDIPNAPMKHAEYMARHIPHAELWVPKGVGHVVHEEILNEWLGRIPDFWARRGTPEGEALHRYAVEQHADDREGPFQVRVAEGRVVGTVLTEAMRQEAARVAGLPAEDVKVLLAPGTPWALVNRPVDDLRRGQGILTEGVSQARLGEAARVLEPGPLWSKVRMEHDGYTGWIHTKALHLCTEEDVVAWRTACNAMVVAGLAEALDEAGEPSQKVVFA
ncbi:MAG TPA: alpha/beta fold hydrolase, partial [Holophaga sp.]|nr:alpha/beta fold hydrolase [Holophaga sp.]